MGGAVAQAQHRECMAILHLQLAQNIRHMLLHRREPDTEDDADLAIDFPTGDPIEHIALARGEAGCVMVEADTGPRVWLPGPCEPEVRRKNIQQRAIAQGKLTSAAIETDPRHCGGIDRERQGQGEWHILAGKAGQIVVAFPPSYHIRHIAETPSVFVTRTLIVSQQRHFMGLPHVVGSLRRSERLLWVHLQPDALIGAIKCLHHANVRVDHAREASNDCGKKI